LTSKNGGCLYRPHSREGDIKAIRSLREKKIVAGNANLPLIAPQENEEDLEDNTGIFFFRTLKQLIDFQYSAISKTSKRLSTGSSNQNKKARSK
jgi:hypothetical protein